MPRTLEIFAPAKINLFLHITGRLDDGYHLLHSLVAFADIGDEVHIEAADEFSFEVKGPFAKAFGRKELDSSPHSSNLAVRAAWLLSRNVHKPLRVRITLIKNLPVAAGIGGGSSDAAAVLWGLMEWWDLPKDPAIAQSLIPELGADLPVCFSCRPSVIRGIGEIIEPVDLPEMPVVLVNPMKLCPTRDVFLRHSRPFSAEASEPGSHDTLIRFLKNTGNDLFEAACETVPDIRNVMHALEAEAHCHLARLSGSGATCFGLFEQPDQARRAAKSIRESNPDWWVAHGILNRPERY